MPHQKRNIQIALYVVLPVLGFLLGWGMNQSQINKTKPEPVEIPKETSFIEKINVGRKNFKPKDADMSLLWETWGQLEANYLYQDKFQTKNQVNGAARGLVDSLEDPYTVFMDAETTKEFNNSIDGQFEGIGAEVTIKDELLTVVSPLKGAPAELAGVQSGDKIIEVNGESTLEMSIIEAITKIRGPRGEKVVLTILRESEEEPLKITIVRDKILTNDLEWEMKDGVAVVTINQFGSGVGAEFRRALNEIILEEPKGIILDLRNNGGGLFHECIDIVEEFFDDKVIVQVRKGGNIEETRSRSGGAFLEQPLVVLINEGSASASEIVAGAIKDHERGLLLGEKTFGKGSVQHTVPLAGGAMLKVTVAEWLTPLGNSINESGVLPHENIQRTREDYENDRDPVLDRALEVIGTDVMRDLMNKKSEEEGE